MDFIEIYDMVPDEAYFARTDETSRIDLPFAGLVPVKVQASEASDTGQKRIDHCCASSVLDECSAREKELRTRMLTELGSEEPQMLPMVHLLLESFDEEKCGALYARFVEKETGFGPTLMMATLPGEARIRKARQRL